MSIREFLGMRDDKWKENDEEIFSIIFDAEESVYFNRLIKMLSNYSYQSDLILENNEMTFKIINPDRSYLVKISKEIEYDKERMEFAVDLEELTKMTKQNKEKNKEKEVKLTFLEEGEIMIEKIGKTGSYTCKTLDTTKLELLNINIDNLMKIKHTSHTHIDKLKLLDLFFELGDYSDEIMIKVDEKRVIFEEVGELGKFTYPIQIKSEFYHIFDEIGEVRLSIDVFKKLTYALDLLEEQDNVVLYIKTIHPVKILLEFKKLKFYMSLFLAPRVSEEEIEDYDNIEVLDEDIKKLDEML